MSANTVRLYYSYSVPDEDLCQEMEQHLALMRRQGLLTTVGHKDVTPGDPLVAARSSLIDEADVVLLLVSASYIASDACFNDELLRALARHQSGSCRVVPVLLRPVEWNQAPFGSLCPLPRGGVPITSWASRDAAWHDVARNLREIIEAISVNRWLSVAARSPAPTAILRSEQLETWAVFSDCAELGRAASCDFSFRVAPYTVGKRHARLLWLPTISEFAIQDLRSIHGTIVAGASVKQLTPIRDGEEVLLAGGGLRLIFTRTFGPEPIGTLSYRDRRGNECGNYSLVTGDELPLPQGAALRKQGCLQLHVDGLTRELQAGTTYSLGKTSVELRKL